MVLSCGLDRRKKMKQEEHWLESRKKKKKKKKTDCGLCTWSFVFVCFVLSCCLLCINRSLSLSLSLSNLSLLLQIFVSLAIAEFASPPLPPPSYANLWWICVTKYVAEFCCVQQSGEREGCTDRQTEKWEILLLLLNCLKARKQSSSSSRREKQKKRACFQAFALQLPLL